MKNFYAESPLDARETKHRWECKSCTTRAWMAEMDAPLLHKALGGHVTPTHPIHRARESRYATAVAQPQQDGKTTRHSSHFSTELQPNFHGHARRLNTALTKHKAVRGPKTKNGEFGLESPHRKQQKKVVNLTLSRSRKHERKQDEHHHHRISTVNHSNS